MRWRRAVGVVLFATLVGSAPSLGARTAHQSSFETALDEARLLIAESRFDAALEFVDEALAVNPTGVEAVRMASLCHWQLGRHRDGLPYVQKLVELSPGEPEARLFLADYLGALARATDQMAAIGWTVRNVPQHPGVRKRLRAMSLNSDASLVESFEALASDVPQDLDAQMALATMYRRHGRLLDALRRLQDSQSFAGKRAFEVHRETALIYAEVRAWDETKLHLDQALKAEPSDPATLFTKAMMHSRRDESEQAIHIYQTLLRQTPDNPMLHFRLGEVYDSTNRPTDAEASYQQALRLQPSIPGVVFRLGKLYLAQGSPEKARPLLEKAVERNPRHPESHLELAQALDRLKQLDSARAHYGKALELNPSFSLAHRSLGNFEMRHGDKDKGRAALSRFQELKSLEKETERLLAESEARPTAFEPRQTLIDHLMTIEEHPLALRLAQRYVLDTPDLDHTLLLGTVHLSMNDGAGASRLFERATRLAPESEIAHRRLAEAYVAAGRPEDAARANTRAVEIAAKNQ